MKRQGIINGPLSGALARLGHTDLLVIADAGLPVPARVPVVDLALVYGVPRFATVLKAIVEEVIFEEAWVSKQADQWPAGAIVDTELGFAAHRIDHAEFKLKVGTAHLVIRTGDDTAFSNVILQCGVPFAV